MATFLFWNINRKPLAKEVAALCHEREVDVLILAESEVPLAEMLQTLNQGQERMYVFPLQFSERLRFFIRYPESMWYLVHDEPSADSHFVVRRLAPPIGVDVTIVAVHLSSKSWRNVQTQATLSRQIVEEIRRFEGRIGHSRMLIIGDFNMNPFEQGMVEADAFHGVMDRTIAARQARKVGVKSYRFFYNPMWGHMGDTSERPPGTYYHSDTNSVAYFWNTFDQVILSPDLLPYFSSERLEVITSVAGQSLLGKSGRPNARKWSDHLPIICSLDIERGG